MKQLVSASTRHAPELHAWLFAPALVACVKPRLTDLPTTRSRLLRARRPMRMRMADGCLVSFDPGGRVEDGLLRAPLANALGHPAEAAVPTPFSGSHP